MIRLILSFVAACYLPPVTAAIVEPFVAPACTYCAGHRGVEYDVASGTTIHAAAAGTVTFNGLVAGTRYVVVLHEDGIRATYGMVQASQLRPGDHVGAGATVGRSTSRLYFGLRARDGTALDPAALLGVARRHPRLVPSDGSPGRPAATREPTCAGVG